MIFYERYEESGNNEVNTKPRNSWLSFVGKATTLQKLAHL